MRQNWLILTILTYSNQIVSTFSVHNRLFLKTLQPCKLRKKKNKVNKKKLVTMSCRQSCQSRHPCTKGNIRAVCEESHFYSLPPATVHAVATTNSKNVETLPRKTTFLASNRSWSQVCEI